MKRKRILALGCALALSISGILPVAPIKPAVVLAADSSQSTAGSTNQNDKKESSETQTVTSSEDKKDTSELQNDVTGEDKKSEEKETQDTKDKQTSDTRNKDSNDTNTEKDVETDSDNKDSKDKDTKFTEDDMKEGTTENSDTVSLFKKENSGEKDKKDKKEEISYLDVTVDHSKLNLQINEEFELPLIVTGGQEPYRIHGYAGPDWLKADGITFKGTPPKAGVYVVSYEVWDANDKASWGLDLQLVVGGGDETMPKVKLAADKSDRTLVMGEEFRLPIEISGGTAPYTVKLYSAPEWMKLENNNLVGKPGELLDEYYIGIGVIDANGTEGEIQKYAISVVKTKEEKEKMETVEASKEKKDSPKEEKEDSNTSNTSKAVKTGDVAPIGILVVLLVAAGIGIVIVTKRKKKDK